MSDWPEAAEDGLVAAVPSLPPELFDDETDVAPWDSWYERALDADVDAELAELGRRLMCEAALQGWSRRLRRECGLEDEGEAMLELATDDPDAAEARWRRLLSR